MIEQHVIGCENIVHTPTLWRNSCVHICTLIFVDIFLYDYGRKKGMKIGFLDPLCLLRLNRRCIFWAAEIGLVAAVLAVPPSVAPQRGPGFRSEDLLVSWDFTAKQGRKVQTSSSCAAVVCPHWPVNQLHTNHKMAKLFSFFHCLVIKS